MPPESADPETLAGRMAAESAAAATPEATVFVVDDDGAVRDSLKWLLESVGLAVEVFDSAAAFLGVYDPERPGCIIADVRMPGMSGLEMQKELAARPAGPPLIVITGHGDVQMAVHAMKAGAYDFVEKPFNDERLIDLVQRAVADNAAQLETRALIAESARCLSLLTPREGQVLGLLIAGESNKGVANALGITDKTVEAHRARVMEKFNATSFADLMRKVMILEDFQPPR
jgi:FixJ family two-component response regulator